MENVKTLCPSYKTIFTFKLTTILSWLAAEEG